MRFSLFFVITVFAFCFLSFINTNAGIYRSLSKKSTLLDQLPAKYDLREKSLVTSVKSQSGGTCWTHAAAASLESNLLLTKTWSTAGEQGEPDLAEYHLDWWNGFNRHFNPDTEPTKNGLVVHQGGDYLVASAYLSLRGSVRNSDGQSYQRAPDSFKPSYRFYYPRHIEWVSSETNDIFEKTKKIKEAILNAGAVGTALAWSNSFYESSSNSFYQPKTSGALPNHAVTIVGWDDNKKTRADQKGAWLIKNSWGSGWGDGGYFWISYYDKVAGTHPQMGAVSFREVEPFKYDRVYAHDMHGWRDTKKDALAGMNVFKAEEAPANKTEYIKSVSFYTTEDKSDFEIKVYRGFENNQLSGEVARTQGNQSLKGFHTVDLDAEIPVLPGETFYITLNLSNGGLAYDKTSDVPVLLCSKTREKIIVISKAQKGQSFYYKDSAWRDLTEEDSSANLAIKALTIFR